MKCSDETRGLSPWSSVWELTLTHRRQKSSLKKSAAKQLKPSPPAWGYQTTAYPPDLPVGGGELWLESAKGQGTQIPTSRFGSRDRLRSASWNLYPTGVFPTTGQTKAQLKSEEFLQERGSEMEIDRNYSSFHEHEAESQAELRRLIDSGHVEIIGSWKQVQARWPNARATKIATLVKARPDGTNKVRFVVDMLRSGVNALTKAEERIVLPRGADLVRDILDLLESQDGKVEIMTADFSDAFLNLGIKENERGSVIIKTASGQYAAYAGVPFGLATAPLLWGRAAAWLGRTAQALHTKWDHRMQIYVDDPALVARGTRSQRTWTFARTLLYWAALGARIAMHKVERGHTVKWIGAVYSIRVDGVQVSVDAERINKLTKVVTEALQARGLIPGIRSLAGELSWVAGIVPTTRPFVNMIWAALTGMNTQNQRAHGKGQRQRPEGSVLAPMVHLPLTWFLKFLKGENGGLKRLRLTRDRASRPSWIIRTDASTTGAGGILLTASGKPVRWWAHPLEAKLLDPLGVKAGEPGKMTTYEILALLISLRTWSTHIRNHRIGVLVQLDSESALRVATKLASPHPVVNRLAAEVALCLENLRLETITGQHWRNVINIEADALSRLQEGYSVPSRLQKLPRDNIVPTSELFFLHCSSVASWSFVSSRRRGGVVCCFPFRFSRVPVLVVSVDKYLPQLGSNGMFCLLFLATWGIVPWDLTTFLVCDLLVSATVVAGIFRRCRGLGKSPGDPSALQPERSKWPYSPTHAASAKKEPHSELETTVGRRHPPLKARLCNNTGGSNM